MTYVVQFRKVCPTTTAGSPIQRHTLLFSGTAASSFQELTETVVFGTLPGLALIQDMRLRKFSVPPHAPKRRSRRQARKELEKAAARPSVVDLIMASAAESSGEPMAFASAVERLGALPLMNEFHDEESVYTSRFADPSLKV